MAMEETNTDRRTLLASAIIATGAAMPLATAAAQDDQTNAGGEHHHELAEKIRALDRSISDLGADRNGDQLIIIIHHPAGWTTIVEEALVTQAIETMQQQISSVREQYRKLVQTAGLVGH
jgi:hypothetical protein